MDDTRKLIVFFCLALAVLIALFLGTKARECRESGGIYTDWGCFHPQKMKPEE